MPCSSRASTPTVANGWTGGKPAGGALDAAQLSGEPRVSARALRTLDLAFVELLPRSLLAGHTENEFAVASDAAFTPVRLKIYPDRGVARRGPPSISSRWSTAACRSPRAINSSASH